MLVDGFARSLSFMRLADANDTDPKYIQAAVRQLIELCLISVQPGVGHRAKGYIATGRQKHGSVSATAKRPPKPGSLIARMTTRLRRAGHRSRYRLRKQVVEPVFGQIKQARGFRQFLLRGIDKAKAEWALICTVHNLRKLAPTVA